MKKLDHKLLKEAENKINNIQIKEAESYLDLTTEELVKRALKRFGRKSDADEILKGIKKRAENDVHMILAALSFANDSDVLEKDAVCQELLKRLQIDSSASLEKEAAFLPLVLTGVGSAAATLFGKSLWDKYNPFRPDPKLLAQNLSLIHDPYVGSRMISNWMKAGGKITPEHLQALQRMYAAQSNPWFSGRY